MRLGQRWEEVVLDEMTGYRLMSPGRTSKQVRRLTGWILHFQMQTVGPTYATTKIHGFTRHLLPYTLQQQTDHVLFKKKKKKLTMYRSGLDFL